MRIVKSGFYDSVAVSRRGRAVLLKQTTLDVRRGQVCGISHKKWRAIEAVGNPTTLDNPSDEPLFFVPEPGVVPNGFVRKIEDKKLCAEKRRHHHRSGECIRNLDLLASYFTSQELYCTNTPKSAIEDVVNPNI